MVINLNTIAIILTVCWKQAFSKLPWTHNCSGVRLCSVLRGCLIQAATHSWNLSFMTFWRQKCKLYKSLSLIESRILLSSMTVKRLLKSSGTSVYTFLHKRSFHWLWTHLPTSAEPRPVPRLWIMYCTTSIFSPPRLLRIREGSPHWATASRKQLNTVDALIFVLHER